MYDKQPLYLCDEYSIDTNGVVYSKSGRPLKPSINHKGYEIVNLMINNKRIGASVHTLVATQFLVKPNEECNQVNHKDGIKTNNHIENLEWVTPKQNIYHAMHKLKFEPNKSRKKPVVAYTEAEYIEFCSLREAIRNMSKTFGISLSISAIYKAIENGVEFCGYYWKYK